jgi:very-short-patch-repair endonuclease
LNLGVEFDGPFHHKHRDARRDRWILEFVKIKVFRYKTEEDNEELKKFLGVTDGERQTDPG